MDQGWTGFFDHTALGSKNSQISGMIITLSIVAAGKVGPYILAADLALGRGEYAMRYLRAHRERQKT